jgi:hypothetical protein
MLIQSEPSLADSARQNSRQPAGQQPVEGMVELKLDTGEIIVIAFVPGPSPSDGACPDRAASQARGRAFSYVLGFANSGFGEPTLGPFKAAFGVI